MHCQSDKSPQRKKRKSTAVSVEKRDRDVERSFMILNIGIM
jgi:hypothetical protein